MTRLEPGSIASSIGSFALTAAEITLLEAALAKKP